MNEKIRILMPTEIPGIDDGVDITAIERDLNGYIKKLTPRINFQELDDWGLLILVNSRATNRIGFYKRSRRYPSGKDFEISISIPIPDNEQAPYGLADVKESFYCPVNENFYTLEPDFENYDNLYSYILESSKRAIDLAFTHGFVCNGKNIKFQK